MSDSRLCICIVCYWYSQSTFNLSEICSDIVTNCFDFIDLSFWYLYYSLWKILYLFVYMWVVVLEFHTVVTENLVIVFVLFLCCYTVSSCLWFTGIWRHFVLYDFGLWVFDYYFLKYVRRLLRCIVFVCGVFRMLHFVFEYQ